ncbi:FAD-dependent thymidylate synthase [Streptomyces sp. NPDC002078]
MIPEHSLHPTLYVIARPSLESAEVFRFLDAHGEAWRQSTHHAGDSLVEFAARVCYMSFGRRQSPRTNQEFIANLIRQGHESVLEHASWTILISGVTRAFTHQLVRHRAGWSYSQLSQQYHDESMAQAIVPRELKDWPHLLSKWKDVVDQAHRVYAEIIHSLDKTDEGSTMKRREETRRIRSAARSILPEATETKIVATANARAIRHFLTVRGAILGDAEMRLVSAALFRLVSADAPGMFADFTVEELEDGLPVVRRASCIA